MKLLSINGYLYRSYWNKQKGYTCKASLHLADNQNNRRIAQKIIRTMKQNKIDDYVEASVNYIRLSKALQEFLEFKNLKPKT